MKTSAYIIEIEQSEKETGRTMYNTRHELAKLITHKEQLENNRDKAIEYIKMHSNALGVLDTIENYTLLDILGDKK